MNFDFRGKLAVVVGGTKGIGLRCAEMLALGKAKVAVISRDPKNIKSALEKIKKDGEAFGYEMDINNISAIPDMVKRIRQDMGEIDILICSAGVNFGKSAIDVSEPDWDRLFQFNLKGTYFFNTAVAAQSMIPRKTGAIVNIASAAGLMGVRFQSVYGTSKAAVIHFTKVLALEWADHNVRVNAIAPTWVKTDLIASLLNNKELTARFTNSVPLHRICSVDDVAPAVCFLASDAAAMITGITLPIDGGLSSM
jgi:2-deoxy-D-gluconate 3-dehydrogenase